MAVVETHDLRKTYKAVEALRGVSVRVEQGQVYGLLGRNGAGKTTLVKILLGIIKPTGGAAELLDQPAGRPDARRHVGYLPEDHRFPEYHTASSLLDFYGDLYGLTSLDRRARADEALALVGLKDRKHSKVRTFSKGMKQRLGIAQALFHDPKVVFLDEPTDGVDPIGRREIRAILQKLKERGVTVFLNSHLLSEVELLCDRVAIMENGRLVREGSVAELTQERDAYIVGLADGEAMPADELKAFGLEPTPAGPFWEVVVPPGKSIDLAVDLFRNRGLRLRHLVEKRQTLEDVFLKTVDSAEPASPPKPARPATLLPLPTPKGPTP